jgi:hypothetical protein
MGMALLEHLKEHVGVQRDGHLCLWLRGGMPSGGQREVAPSDKFPMEIPGVAG